ncbi:hypothetical protein BKA81DRAFT_123896 [Phyllosticta paracitricarpa]
MLSIVEAILSGASMRCETTRPSWKLSKASEDPCILTAPSLPTTRSSSHQPPQGTPEVCQGFPRASGVQLEKVSGTRTCQVHGLFVRRPPLTYRTLDWQQRLMPDTPALSDSAPRSTWSSRAWPAQSPQITTEDDCTHRFKSVDFNYHGYHAASEANP